MSASTLLLDQFHKHLDECDQCNRTPFGLCKLGNLLLKGAVDEAALDFPVLVLPRTDDPPRPRTPR